MASNREGIALLSMYNDEEEEEDEETEPPQAHEQEEEKQIAKGEERDGQFEEYDDFMEAAAEAVEEEAEEQEREEEEEEKEEGEVPSYYDAYPQETPPPMPPSRTPPYAVDAKPSPVPSNSPMVFDPSPSPLRPPPPHPASRPSTPVVVSVFPAVEAMGQRRTAGAAVAIVDYAHDENAFSPEAEEGEMVADLDMLDAQLQETDGSSDDRCSTGAAQVLSPPAQATPQSYEQLEATFKVGTSMAVDDAGPETDAFPSDENMDVYVEIEEDLDPLKKFLPPPPTTRCPQELQEKINKFLALKRSGKSFNSELRNMKAYRNPDFLQHAVRYQEINQLGTCFSKDVFDPEGYDKSDYYDEIEADMKRELERKELERKRSPKVDFVAGGTQTGMVASAPKIGAQLSGSTVIATSQTAVSASLDVSSKESRQSKKSKWDKVDVDTNIPLLSGGSNGMSTIPHSATIAGANIGSGYSAFVQQKRREAEERHSSERKYDKRT